MWTSGALSVFNDKWADNFIEDPASSSDQVAERPPGEFPAGGQISPGGREYLNLPGGDVFMGTELDEWRTQTSTANQGDRTIASFGQDHNFLRPVIQQDDDPSHASDNPTYNDNTQMNLVQDFNMDPSMNLPNLEWSLDGLQQSQTDPTQFPQQDHLADFDVQHFIAQNPSFFQQALPGPLAPLSPALTPPPSSFSKHSNHTTPPDTTSTAIQSKKQPVYETDDQRWEATLSRSHAADRSFLYGVTTTKIFCRPSCPSRRATRKNVAFFTFPGAIEAATNANFRPCKRCKPETLGTADAGILGVIKVLGLIINDATSPFSPDETATKLETLAEAGGLSAFHFHRLFKSTTNLTPGELIAACRSLALGDALGMDNKSKINDGQNDLSHHRLTDDTPPSATALIATSTKWNPRTARKALGSVSPTDYAAGCRSQRIHRITTDTAQGPMCIAYSPHRGDVFAVLIGSDAEERVSIRFPGIETSGTNAKSLERCVKELEEAGFEREGDIPEDLKGWLWRARVWVRVVRDGVLKDNDD